jgi:hypothetical protein
MRTTRQPKLLRLSQGAPELVALNDGTEIEQRSRDRRGGDPVVDGGLVLGEGCAMKTDALARALRLGER